MKVVWIAVLICLIIVFVLSLAFSCLAVPVVLTLPSSFLMFKISYVVLGVASILGIIFGIKLIKETIGKILITASSVGWVCFCFMGFFGLGIIF